MNRGVFISFEGIEGTGKSTQARLLFDYLKSKGIDALLTFEPGGTPIGRKIREVLLSPEHEEMDAVAELMLYLADRRQHISEVILPELDAGKTVVTDRFSDSTMAYQGYGRGIGRSLIDSLNNAATGGLKPDLTLLLDIDVEAGLLRNRKARKTDRLELQERAFHERVREGYLAIQKAEPARVVIVDARGGIEDVGSAIRDVVLKFLKTSR